MASPAHAHISLAELARAIRSADPSAYLVPPRILRRVIRSDRNLVGIGLDVPHRRSYVIRREALRPLVEKEELGLQSDGNIPATVILLAQPDAEELANFSRDQLLLGYWRLLFHAHVHLAMERRLAERRFTEAFLRQRIHRIGQTEFNEIRTVLRQEHLLLPPRDARTVYVEFAAVYLELRRFAPGLLPRYFPGLQAHEGIDAILADDVDAARLFAGTRLPGASDPEAKPSWPGPPAERGRAGATGPQSINASYSNHLTGRANRAAAAGNVVRALILRTQAARALDAVLAEQARDAARAELGRLADRLQAALGQDDVTAAEWLHALAPLQKGAARDIWPPEERLLYDLQKVCVDRERSVYAVDLAEWMYSLGRRPVKRRLEHQPDVLVLKYLRRAARRLTAVQLDDKDRTRLADLLAGAVHHAEARVSERLRPLIEGTLREVGMVPRNFPEETGLAKLTEELLDRIVETGHVNMGHLRDALSRNSLKQSDLSGPGELVLGNQLLRANQRLALVLDGVYHRGEVYLRELQRFSLLAFGTRLGRLLTRYVALPFGGAFVILEGLYHLIADLSGAHLHALASPAAIAGLGAFLFLLLHVAVFRRGVLEALKLGGRGVRAVLSVPATVLRWPLLRQLLRSRAAAVLYHYGLKPLALALPVGLFLYLRGRPPEVILPSTTLAFLAANAVLNSRLGRDLEEAVGDWLALSWRRLAFDIVPGIGRLIMEAFKRAEEEIDRVLYTVDEWLRFHAGDSRLSLVGKAVLGLFWAMISYVVRFAVLLLIEPQINPLKHFPVVTVSHKLLLPLIPSLARVLKATAGMEEAVALTAATLIIGGIPGIFGFLVWELKENWRLYEANRPDELQPAVIGHHGETVRRFLRPGFHSGTVPKLYARLRRAERRALRTGDHRAADKQRDALHHVEESIRHFVERELLALLAGSKAWGGLAVDVGAVTLASNRARIELCCPSLAKAGMSFTFEEQSGWLLAGIASPGWLDQLSGPQRSALRAALAGLYKRAGVDLVREQIEAAFAPSRISYDIDDAGLVVWPGGREEVEAVYDLHAGPSIPPRFTAGEAASALPVLSAVPLRFRNVPLTWQAWVDFWEQDHASKPLPDGFLEGVCLLPARAE